MEKMTKRLCDLAFYSLVIFSLVPLLRLCLPMDTAEAVVWGKYCLWGTTKHPPLSGWLAYGFYKAFGSQEGALYLLSQLCAVCGIWYIYKLARCFLSAEKSAAAAMLQFGIIYYGYSAPEYNVNVLSLLLWPACTYYFWRAYREDKLSDWLLLGIFAGLNLLNKYVCAVLFCSLFVFMLWDKSLPRLLKNYKAYLSAAVALALFAPHLYWLYENNFETFNYFAARGGTGTASAWGHILYPLKFCGAQLLFAAAALVTYGVFYAKSEKEAAPAADTSEWRFIAAMTAAPVLLFALSALVSGNALKSMWGFPCLFMWGTALVYFLPLKFTEDTGKNLVRAMFVWITLFAAAYAVQCLLTTSKRFSTDAEAFSQTMRAEWLKHTGRPLVYAGADVWYADILALYGSPEVKPVIWLKPESNPWFDKEDIARNGALVMADSAGGYAAYRSRCRGVLSEPLKMNIEAKNYFGKTKTREVFYGFCLPEEVKNAD